MQITDEFILKETYGVDVEKIPNQQIDDLIDLLLNVKHKRKRTVMKNLSDVRP